MQLAQYMLTLYPEILRKTPQPYTYYGTAENNACWYASWFDTPYYHILYKDRDYEEAQLFMDNLTAYLNLPDDAKILDLACSKGGHSVYLNKLGYNVTGADLSANSISEAKKYENDTLHFMEHDMHETVSLRSTVLHF